MGMTNLREIYSRGEHVLSIECWPPKTEAGELSMFAELDRMAKLNPAFCSMTYGGGGSTRDKTVDLVTRIEHERGIEMMCHLTVAGQSKAEVRSVLDQLRDAGVHNIIALGGDPAPGTEWAPHPDGFAHADELIAEALGSAYGDWFAVAVAGFPEVHPRAQSRESDLRYLKGKVDAGACVVITQLFLDNADYFRFVADARRAGIEVPIVPGMMPFRSAAQVRRFTTMCEARIPAKLDGLLNSVADDDTAAVQLGIDYLTEQCAELLDFGVPGFHFYALNKADAILEIYSRLDL